MSLARFENESSASEYEENEDVAPIQSSHRGSIFQLQEGKRGSIFQLDGKRGSIFQLDTKRGSIFQNDGKRGSIFQAHEYDHTKARGSIFQLFDDPYRFDEHAISIFMGDLKMTNKTDLGLA